MKAVVTQLFEEALTLYLMGKEQSFPFSKHGKSWAVECQEVMLHYRTKIRMMVRVESDASTIASDLDRAFRDHAAKIVSDFFGGRIAVSYSVPSHDVPNKKGALKVLKRRFTGHLFQLMRDNRGSFQTVSVITDIGRADFTATRPSKDAQKKNGLSAFVPEQRLVLEADVDASASDYREDLTQYVEDIRRTSAGNESGTIQDDANAVQTQFEVENPQREYTDAVAEFANTAFMEDDDG
jgi:hypothetical protein